MPLYLVPLEKQVCSFELAVKIKELGVKQEGYYEYFVVKDSVAGSPSGYKKISLGTTAPLSYVEKDRKTHEYKIYKAFTVAELGALLSKHEAFIEFHYNYHIGHWECLFFKTITKLIHETESESEADSRAEMLIYLIENKYIDVKDLNKSHD